VFLLVFLSVVAAFCKYFFVFLRNFIKIIFRALCRYGEGGRESLNRTSRRVGGTN
jgi:hypothetical protein